MKFTGARCSYWERRILLEAERRGIGGDPEKVDNAIEQVCAEEDRRDPPCGTCKTCREWQEDTGDRPGEVSA